MTAPIGFKDDDEALAHLQTALDGGFEQWQGGSSAAPGAPSAPPMTKAPDAQPILREPGAPPATDSELAELQAFAKRRRQAAAVGQAGENFAKAFLSNKRRAAVGDSGFWNNYAAEGDREIADYGARKQEAEKKAAIAKTAEQRAAIGRYIKANFPGKFDNMTDEAAGDLLAPATTVFKEQSEMDRATAMAKAKAAAEAAEAARKAKEEADRHERDRGEKLTDVAGDRKWREGQSALDRASREKAAALSAGTKASDKINDDIKDLSHHLPPGAGGFYEQLDNIKRIIAKSPKGDIPGVGTIDSRLPVALQSPEGKELRKYADQMMLAYQNLVTGTGGSEKEMQKIRDAGADLGNEESFMKGLEALERGYTARLKQTYAGYRPEVTETYQQRNPQLKPRDAAGPETPPVPKPPPAGDGWTRGMVGGKPGWVSADKTEFEPD